MQSQICVMFLFAELKNAIANCLSIFDPFTHLIDSCGFRQRGYELSPEVRKEQLGSEYPFGHILKE